MAHPALALHPAPITHRLRLIMSDETRRDTPTDVAPPMTERDTLPPSASEEAATLAASKTMLPAPPDYWKSAYDKLIEIHEDNKRDRAAREQRDSELFSKLGRIQTTGEETKAAVTQLRPRVDKIEEQLLAMQDEILKLHERLEAQEQDLAETKKLILEAEERWNISPDRIARKPS